MFYVGVAAVQHTRDGVWRHQWAHGGTWWAEWRVECGPSWPMVHIACMRGPGGEAKANAISRHAAL